MNDFLESEIYEDALDVLQGKLNGTHRGTVPTQSQKDLISTLSHRPQDWLNIQQGEQLDFNFLESLRALGKSFISLFSWGQSTTEPKHEQKTETIKPKT
jgi:hypothetical protein